ncbi:MAG: bifunctional serine/threonine-protein kinase/formylglycine-generating enzyme family protein [Myxococcota bacterium]|nr:bifunctional serine/threonine-protein kinase/formylglycine-generating enzyme family protein [Myxococcota bacterium]
MDKLAQLLEEANATPEQREEIRRLFSFEGFDATVREGRQVTEDTVVSARPVSKEDDGKDLLTDAPRLGRYEDLGMIGKGGMGEVRRILDPKLQRRLAMKLLRPEFLTSEAVMSRFIEEAQIIAQLQHPNIIPVHEIGQLDDGQLYFTMKEVRGKPLSEIITQVHEASQNGTWQESEDGWTFRKLINIFSQVCATVAFANSRGVVHRDLKPENILVDTFDQVLVVDWGIAKILGKTHDRFAEVTEMVEPSRADINQTRMGEVTGTPSYMAPEQARGEVDKIDQRTDVYGLGAILYEILSGRCPYGGASFRQVLNKVILGPPPSVRETIISLERSTQTIELDFFDFEAELVEESVKGSLEERTEKGVMLPEDLVRACEKAMHRSQSSRYQSANDFQRVIIDWIDGANRREKALAVVTTAKSTDTLLKKLHVESQEIYTQTAEQKKDLPDWAGESELAAIWEREDRAEHLLMEKSLLEARRQELLKGALTHKADVEEAHIELLLDYKNQHIEAEKAGDEEMAAKARMGVEAHLNMLPKESPIRIETLTYLQGTGKVSVKTNPVGAEVWVSSFEIRSRRMILGKERLLGHTPLEEMPLEMGSYSLRIHKEGYHDVTYPVRIERLGHWSGRTPDGEQPAIWLPPIGTLSPNECYVPAGSFLNGRCDSAQNPSPDVELWVDGFIVSRYPVTYEQYRAYLQDLRDKNRADELLAAMPSEQAAGASSSGASGFFVNEQGIVEYRKDPKGLLPQADWPVAYISFQQALAYIKWLNETSEYEWRLLNEYEWEKAGRGVDGRTFPWGNFLSPAWCNMDQSKQTQVPCDIYAYPIDESVYGIVGMAGNIAEWTSSAWVLQPDLPPYSRVDVKPPYPSDTTYRCWRGGGWNMPTMMCTMANRIAFSEEEGASHLGFRIARSLPN